MEPILRGRNAVVLTASDRCYAGTQLDRSGPAVADLLTEAGATIVEIVVVPDDLEVLVEALRVAAGRAEIVVTTGGTGFSPRDNTPEATLAVCTRLVPGLPELIRRESARETPFAALSRGTCGILDSTLILNLPGNPTGAATSLQTVLFLLPHALDLLRGHTDHATASAQAG